MDINLEISEPCILFFGEKYSKDLGLIALYCGHLVDANELHKFKDTLNIVYKIFKDENNNR